MLFDISAFDRNRNSIVLSAFRRVHTQRAFYPIVSYYGRCSALTKSHFVLFATRFEDPEESSAIPGGCDENLLANSRSCSENCGIWNSSENLSNNRISRRVELISLDGSGEKKKSYQRDHCPGNVSPQRRIARSIGERSEG